MRCFCLWLWSVLGSAAATREQRALHTEPRCTSCLTARKITGPPLADQIFKL